MGSSTGTRQKYQLKELLLVNVGDDSYADDISTSLYPPSSTEGEFTWDAASASVVGTKSSEGFITFVSSTDYLLSMKVHTGSFLDSEFVVIHNGERLLFKSAFSRSPTTTLTLQGGAAISLDVDGNGTVGLLTDGLLLVRYLIGTRGAALTNLALAAGAHENRDTHEEITAYLDSLVPE